MKICSSNIPVICPVDEGKEINGSVQDYINIIKLRPVPLSVIIPTYEPPAIRYTYPNRPPVIIGNGVTYTLDEQPTYFLGNYRVRTLVTRNLYYRGTLYAVGYEARDYYITNGIYKRMQPPSVTLVGGSTAVCLNFPDQALIYTDVNGNEAPSSYYTCVAGIAWNFGNNEYVSEVVTEIEQLSGTPPEVLCKIYIYDVNNTLLHNDEGVGCPEVDILPENCFYDANTEQNWITVTESGFYIYSSVEESTRDGKKCVTAYVNVTDINAPNYINSVFVKSEQATICSPDKCDLPPLVCYDCLPRDCVDCPNGTVYQLLEGNTIFCIDYEGCVLAEVEYNPDCHNPNCNC